MNSAGRRSGKDPIKLNEKLLDILITNLNVEGISKKNPFIYSSSLISSPVGFLRYVMNDMWEIFNSFLSK